MLNATHAATLIESAEELYVREPARPAAQGGMRQSGESDADRALVEAVARALRATGHPGLRDLDIEITAGIVVLWGRVSTYHQKQLAQAMAQKVEGVRGVANGVEVVCCRSRAANGRVTS